MLEDKDVQKLIEVFATREEIATRADLKEVRKDLEKFSSQAFETFATKEDIKDLKQDIEGLREQVQALTIAVDK